MSEQPGVESAPHGCLGMGDARECYELRYYGYSPVLRSEDDHSEGQFMEVDEDGECECDCHEEDADATD